MFYNETRLRTEIKLNSNDYPKFGLDSIWCGIGSCFSDNLLVLLEECGFDISRNPSGIIYNSFSMLEVISRAVDEHFYSRNDFFEHNGIWHSWGHHGSFSNADLNEAVTNANRVLKRFREKLETADALVLTPSSSVIYRYDGDIVANCHKVDNKHFARQILSAVQNREYLNDVVTKILKINADCKIIFTLSPVRHYPGDLILNARSKANLLTAIHEVCDINPGSCLYFPAYEILHDELRDYRFYKTDMMHPSGQAVRLICGRFAKLFFTAETLKTMDKELGKAKFIKHVPRGY